jgi:hypothetical protein
VPGREQLDEPGADLGHRDERARARVADDVLVLVLLAYNEMRGGDAAVGTEESHSSAFSLQPHVAQVWPARGRTT